MDDLDLRIVRELVRDGRMSMSHLAARVHLSRAHVYRRVERLTSDGVIRGISADVDACKAGLRVGALVLLQAHQERWQELHDGVRAMAQVQYAAATTGDFDMVVIVRAESIEVLRDVVLGQFALMAAVRTSKTLLVLDEIISARPVVPSAVPPSAL
jgi:DNA-binding Lrp family transcriptional regulator